MEPLTLLICLLVAVVVLYIVWFVANKLGLPEPVPVVILLVALILLLVWILGGKGIL